LKAIGIKKDINWIQIANQLGNKYTSIQCHQHYYRVISPDLNRKIRWSKEEDAILISNVDKLGMKWSVIQKDLPGRSDTNCRQRYLSILKKNGQTLPRIQKTNMTINHSSFLNLQPFYNDIVSNIKQTKFLAIKTNESECINLNDNPKSNVFQSLTNNIFNLQNSTFEKIVILPEINDFAEITKPTFSQEFQNKFSVELEADKENIDNYKENKKYFHQLNDLKCIEVDNMGEYLYKKNSIFTEEFGNDLFKIEEYNDILRTPLYNESLFELYSQPSQ